MGRSKILPANPDAIFLPYQAAWIKDTSRLKLAEKPRQVGWSWSAGYTCAERTGRADAKFDQWVSSRDEMQAKLFIEDCKLWAKVIDLAAEDEGEVVLDPKQNLSAYVLRFANGKRIHSMSSNPDAQAGKRGGRVLDEFALHPDPRKLWSIAYPGITWGGSLEVFSTHRGTHNFFNQLIREVREKGNPKGISLHSINLQQVLEQGFLYKLQQALAPDVEQQDMDEAEYFDWVRSGCADEESFLQEYMCQPADDDAAFLEYDLIASGEYRAGEDWEITLEQARSERRELYAGLDIGRHRDLTVLWVVERLGDVLYTRKVIALARMSKPDQERIVWPWLACMSRVCIDYTGLGIGWGDDALAQFGSYRIENVTFTPRVKEALAYPIRGRLEDRTLRLPQDGVIRSDLRMVTKQTTSAGNVRFTAERTKDGHADRFWSLGLAIHAAATPAAPIEFASTGPRVSANLTMDDRISARRFTDTGFGTVAGRVNLGGF